MGEEYLKNAFEAYKASCYGSTNVKSFDQFDDRDMMVTKKARSIVRKHNFMVDATRIDVRVVHEIPRCGIFGGEVLGRCASYGPKGNWEGSVIMVAEKAYKNKPVLEGVLRHELAHAIHGTYDRAHPENDPNFQRLCKYLGGFVTWGDVEKYL